MRSPLQLGLWAGLAGLVTWTAAPRLQSFEQTQTQSPEVTIASERSAYYPNCSAARAAAAAPIYQGQPGYREELDRDADGIACEPYRGR